MTAAGVTAVTVEWEPVGLSARPTGRCDCRPVALLAGPFRGLVHESDAARPGRCATSLASADEHLRGGLEQVADGAWRACADVLYSEGVWEAAVALRLVRWTLEANPGCLLAGARLADGGCVALSRSGRCLRALGPALSVREHGCIVSLLHGWVASGVRLQAECPSRVLIRSRSRSVSLGLIEA